MSTDENTTTQVPRDDRTTTRMPRLPLWLQAWPMPARIAVIVVAVLLIVFLLAVGADAAVSAGRIHPGVRVGDVAVGGKSAEDAAVAIAAHVAERSALPVNVQAGDASWDIAGEAIGLSVDATALAGEAYAVGRGEFVPAVTERVAALARGVELPLRLDCDAAAIEALVNTINASIATPAVDAGVVVEGVSVTRTVPKDGVGVDNSDALARIPGAFLTPEHSVTLQLGAISPAIDEAAAQDAYDAALSMVSGPLVLYYGDRQWEVPASTIGDWIGFRRSDGSGTPALEAFLDSAEVSATVLPMVAEVGKPAKDAGFQASSGTVTIVPSEDGLAADTDELTTRLATVLTGSGERRAELTMRRVEPEITTADAQGMGIVERISTFTTDYAASNKPRVNNIHTLADALDGTLVAPGGTFSFNETIGPRTAAKGYQEAPAIVGGKLVPQLGGGICQVGTTIFNTVFFSGLPVVERHNHSQYISHYPTGRDATVSWGGPDFKFMNDTPNWVLVATGYTNSSVTISLYGTKPGYDVTYETGPFTDLRDPPVKEVPDPTLPAGSRIVDERGISGRTVIVVRHVTKAGAEIRTDTFKSVYKPAEEVVRVGTMPVSVPATTTP